MKALIIILTSCLFLTGCVGKKEPASQESTENTETEVNKNISTWYEGEIPFVFNVAEDYPETKIRLSELADISYIPIGMNDTFLIRGLMSCNGNDFCVTGDRVYMMDLEKEIYVFKPDGTPIRTINRKGKGPGEYNYISSYAVDTLRQELFIQDSRGKRTLVYDTDGNFKRTFPNLAKEISILNDSLLINRYEYNPGGPRYDVIRKSDGSQVKACHIRFNVAIPPDFLGRLAYGSLIPSPNGVFLSNLGNDTIFEIQRNMKVRPRIIDKSNYGTPVAQAHPTIETNRYLLFYILRSQNYQPVVKQNFYLYDKMEKQIYKCADFQDNAFWALMEDYPYVTNWEIIQNSGMAIRLRSAEVLIKYEDHCHGELKQIAAKLKTETEEQNPVLIVMKFRGN